MSAAKFAQFIGVNYQTLASWVQQRRRERGATAQPGGGAPALRWVEAVVEGEASSQSVAAGLQVHLPGGARLEITDRRQALLAGELLRALATGNEVPLAC